MPKVSPLLVLAFSFSLGMAGGCSPAGPPPPGEKTVVKVAFWGSPEEIEIITQSTKPWEAQHPDIEIRYEHTPFSGYTSKILTRIAGGAPPDIIATEVNMFVSFASKQVLEDLMPYARRDVNFNAGDFFPEVIKRFTVDGKLLAIPRDTAPFACVYYNKNLFDKAGVPYPTDDWTWDDFLEKAQQLTVNDAQGRVLQYGFYGWAWQNFVYSSGGAIVDDVEHPTRCLLDLPESKRGLQFSADLINKHKVMPAPVALANMGMGVDLMFSSGRLAMFLSGIWETPALRQRPFRWDVVMFPIGPGGHRRIATGGTGYAMLKGSKVKKEAWEVIKTLTGPEGQAELARRGLAQPARREVAEGPDFAGHEALPENKKMLNEAVQYVLYDPFHPKWREIEAKVVTPELDLLFNGKQGVEETAAKIVRLVNELLKTEE